MVNVSSLDPSDGTVSATDMASVTPAHRVTGIAAPGTFGALNVLKPGSMWSGVRCRGGFLVPCE